MFVLSLNFRYKKIHCGFHRNDNKNKQGPTSIAVGSWTVFSSTCAPALWEHSSEPQCEGTVWRSFKYPSTDATKRIGLSTKEELVRWGLRCRREEKKYLSRKALCVGKKYGSKKQTERIKDRNVSVLWAWEEKCYDSQEIWKPMYTLVKSFLSEFMREAFLLPAGWQYNPVDDESEFRVRQSSL